MSTKIRVPNAKLGVPDLLLEVDGLGDNTALWILEVSFSQTDKDLMKRVQRFAKKFAAIQEAKGYIGVGNRDEGARCVDEEGVEGYVGQSSLWAWLHHPNGEFSLNKMNSSSYYVCTEICPTRDSTEIAHLDSVFHQAMKFICDKTTGYMQEHYGVELPLICRGMHYKYISTISHQNSLQSHLHRQHWVLVFASSLEYMAAS
ncbi:uncharacterized protein EDB91DRAFT_1088878 [Suillus paluster]|uniref:uncharacterized protein n=1 Tax=Suillus paluster TaxID=48578 RepID=UPI001B87468E|nr:uncharacterized protein EDB91DRAFT_1088878 [Suillus paluster]KAG1720307.1 hypothetical protein EDB91DRAFT_1088878 [Suillus paluster]